MREDQALVALTHTRGLGPKKARFLLDHFGSALEVLQVDPRQILSFQGFGEKIVEELRGWKENDSWKLSLEMAEKQSVTLLTYKDPRYPRGLKQLSDFPLILYMLGEVKDSDQDSIAIVGTRNASVYGKELCEKLSYSISSSGLCVVSGLARGVDTKAHLGALKAKGRTVAFIGSGLAHVYPSENESLAKKIAENGAVLSEYPMQTRPDKRYFPQRNRLVSAMTKASLLIEAPEKSGAMITMDRSFELGRKCFAIPGRVDWPSFKGNHRLIKDRRAQLIEDQEDIFSHLNWSRPKIEERRELGKRKALNFEESQLWEKLPNDERTVDELVDLAEIPVRKLNVLLISLVLKKWVKELPGKLYKKQ